MRIADHLDKVAKLQQLRARLDPMQDFEIWYWATMHAGTHAVNAALHAAGSTVAEDAWAMQPGVYLVPGPDGSRVPAFRPLGDVLHVGRPRVEAPVPPDVDRMQHAMEHLEQYRDACVREGRVPTPQIVAECTQDLATCLAALDARMARDAR